MHLFIFLFSYPLLILISFLPYKILYLISDLLSFFLYRIIKFRLKIVRKNLTLSFPKKTLNQIINIEKKFYDHLSDLIVEMIKNFSISKDEMLTRYKFKNMELIHNQEKKKKSTILILGHFSNWEGMVTIGSHLIGNSYGAYTPLTNKYYQKKIKTSRQKYGSFLLSRYKIFEFVESLKKSKDFGLLGFIGDQSPKKNQNHILGILWALKFQFLLELRELQKNIIIQYFFVK